MAIAFETISSFTGNTAANTVVLGKPTGTVAGNVLVAEVTANATITDPAGGGWTRLFSLLTATSTRHIVSIKVCDGSEPADWTWTLSTSPTNQSGAIARFSGVDGTTPQDVTGVSATGAAATSFSPGALTTVTAGAMLVAGAGANSTSATFTPPASPGAWTEDFDSASGRISTVAHYLMGAAGASGTLTFGISSSREWASWAIALRPAAGVARVFSGWGIRA